MRDLKPSKGKKTNEDQNKKKLKARSIFKNKRWETWKRNTKQKKILKLPTFRQLLA